MVMVAGKETKKRTMQTPQQTLAVIEDQILKIIINRKEIISIKEISLIKGTSLIIEHKITKNKE